MKRKPHILKPTRGAGRPGNIIFFDTETNQTKRSDGSTLHTLRLGVAIYLRRFKSTGYRELDRCTFHTYQEFIDWADRHCRKKSTTYLVAHNIVFDLGIVHAFSEFSRCGWQLQSFYSKATTSIFRWKKDDARLVGIDNMNLFTGKLEKWGKIFGLEKGHVAFDAVTDADLETYCTRDVEIMVRSWAEWLTFLDTHGLGSFKVTTASTAFSAWRHKYMHAKVFIHTTPDALILEREAYHGGRTECFWAGARSDGPFHYVDVNNMYGYVLSKFEYPAGIWNVDLHPTVSRLLRKLEKQAVVARCLIDCTEPVFPNHQNLQVIYPVGSMVVTLTTPEIIYAFQRGWLLDVYSMAWYRKAPLFADYIQDMHALRMEYRHAGNEGYAQIAKLMMNSLYGKFGQTGLEQKRIGDAPPDTTWSNLVVDAKTGEVLRMFALGGGIYEERKAGESANSFPAIAAHVTAHARLYLWSLLQMAGPGHAYYCDTDSLIVDEAGLQNLSAYIDPDRLGYLKVEHTSQTLEINAPKDYRMDDRLRVKGVRRPHELAAFNIVEQEQWERLGGMLQHGTTDDFRVRPITKHLKRSVTSGVLAASGWVSPFHWQAEPGLLDAARQQSLAAMLQGAW